MIFDTLDNIRKYACIHPHIALAARFIAENDLKSLPTGKIHLSGEEAFLGINEYITKNAEDAKWETHNVYTDIQIITEGEEMIGFTNASTLEVTDAYNAEKDIAFYKGEGDFITLKPGMFFIFFAGEAHRPSVTVKNPVKVKKLVFKLKL